MFEFGLFMRASPSRTSRAAREHEWISGNLELLRYHKSNELSSSLFESDLKKLNQRQEKS